MRLALVAVLALGMASLLAGCAPVQRTYDPNGRCLHFQLTVMAVVHPGSTASDPSWDLEYTNTSPVACVFGGVPKVAFRGASAATSAGIVQLAISQEKAVELADGDVGYTNIRLLPPTGACKKIPVRTIAVTAPHVAGGGYVVTAPKGFSGCAGTIVAQVGQTTAHRAK